MSTCVSSFNSKTFCYNQKACAFNKIIIIVKRPTFKVINTVSSMVYAPRALKNVRQSRGQAA